MKVYHTLKPVYNENSRVLILGTMPSPKSREFGFYYGHPQNRFWKVLGDILGKIVPNDINGKKHFLLKNYIALWDVLNSCEIDGAADSPIKKPKVNDFSIILNNSKIEAIFVTGKKALELYNKYCVDKTGIEPIYLPSPSPANRAISYKKLKEEYSRILEFIITD